MRETSMPTIYRHTQRGSVILSFLGGGVLFVLGGLAIAGSHPVLIAMLAVMVACAILFRSMSIEIGDNILAWSFGSGLIRKSVRIADVQCAQVVRNRWLYGWGIHWTPHGWLYNVSGLAAVEIRLKSGKRFRLGTDESEAVVHAIENASSAPAGRDE